MATMDWQCQRAALSVHTCYYDLFRVENGKTAEHWDIMEPIADKSAWQNQNGKF